jgi:alpha-beta hydrolase superfamily lysophospholipase
MHPKDIAYLRCAHANFSLDQWQAEQGEQRYPPEHRITWMFPEAGVERRAVAVLVHGLNTKPDKMDALAHVLNAAGIGVLRVTLQGHGCLSPAEFQGVSTAQWFYDLLRAYCIASSYAREYGLPLYYVGYSAGGGLMVDLIQRKWHEAIRFDKMVLLAPGLSLRQPVAVLSRVAMFLNNLPLLSRWSPVLPYATQWEQYRCHRGTPVAAYSARAHSIKNLQKVGLAGLDNIPTLIFIDPQDELVSKNGIWQMMQKAGLKNWEIIEIHKKDSQYPHHLIIDEVSVGKEQWQKIAKRLQEHLWR